MAGDIDFDSKGNLWLVTGDDTPAGGGNSGGFSPHNDMKTDEFQALRVTNANGGTFTLTYEGQKTAPLPWNATASAIELALIELGNIDRGDVTVTGGNNVSTTNQVVAFVGANSGKNVASLVVDATSLTGTNVDRDGERHAGGRALHHAARRRAAHVAEHQRPPRQGAALQGQGRRHHDG